MSNSKGRRRRFGAVRELCSGQWQARYRGPDGIMRPADHTFPTKTAAEVWLTRKEAEILDGDWIDPDAGQVLFAQYAAAWIEERPNLRPSTLRAYRCVLRRHLIPAFGARAVSEIREPHIRRWRKAMVDAGVGLPTTAKAYVLLKAVLNTAIDDGMIRRNPCRIKGAGTGQSPERPVVTVRQILSLAAVIEPSYRALILLAAFCSLRWGELAALRREDLDLEARTVKIERSLTPLPGGGYSFGPPKSAAGRRTVIIPAVIVPDIARHLDQFVSPGNGDLVFTGSEGGSLHHGNFRKRVWLPAVAAAGLPGIHIHDLRHAGNTLSADAGANLRELMERMGHSTTRAALIYLHGGDQRQRAIADTVSDMVRTTLGSQPDRPAESP
jgi:integrase